MLENVSKWLGYNYLRLQFGLALVNILTLPTTILTYLRVSGFMQVQIPWYLLALVVGSAVLGIAWVLGYILVWSRVIEHQTSLVSQNNPELLRVLEKVEKIEKYIERH